MSRKRQSNVVGGRPVRREVKLSDSEDAALCIAAAELNITVPRYLKESALAVSRGETASERAQLLKRLFGLQHQLSAVGNNLNQIARGVNIEGHVRTELLGTLEALRAKLRDINGAVSSLSFDGEMP